MRWLIQHPGFPGVFSLLVARYNEEMDIFSHGLYGGVAFGRKSKKDYWTAFAFGLLPDLLSFGVLFAFMIGTAVWTGVWPDGPRGGPPELASIPGYVFSLYNLTHSFVTFAVVFGLVWFFRKAPLLTMCAWPLHILVDIFTHSDEFFPTPFLWPLSDYRFDGRSWGDPTIFIPNVLLLTLLYGYWWYRRRKGNLPQQEPLT